MKDRAVVAIEAMEGTDAVIARAGEVTRGPFISREGSEARPGHAVRRAGDRTANDREMNAARGTAIHVTAGKTLLFDSELIELVG